MFWEQSVKALGSAKGLGLKLAGRWNEWLPHYDDSETGQGVRNVQEVKTLQVVQTVSRDQEVGCWKVVGVG